MLKQIIKYFFGVKPNKCQALALKQHDIMVSFENNAKCSIFRFPI
jgi:hypothetical protein